jgi:hypothetical protein
LPKASPSPAEAYSIATRHGRFVQSANTERLNVDIFWLKDEILEDGANLPDRNVIAAEIDSQIPICSPFGLPVHVIRSRELHCRRPPSRPSPVR